MIDSCRNTSSTRHLEGKRETSPSQKITRGKTQIFHWVEIYIDGDMNETMFYIRFLISVRVIK